MAPPKDARTRELLRTAPPPTPEPSRNPTLTGFQLSPSASRSFAPSSPLPPPPTQAPAGPSITGFVPRGGEQVPGSALYEAYSQKLGGLLSPAEVAAAVEDGSISLEEIISAVTPRTPGAGAQAPVERFSHEVIGGRVFRFGDMGSPPVDTGLMAPGFSNVAVNDRGDLTGIDAQGNFRVIQPGYGFAKIDPAKTLAEQQRQFDVGESNVLARSAADREAANQRSLLGAQTAGFQTVAGLAPQLANAALDQQRFISDKISSPADLAYRMFSTRGGTSPFPRVTQADIVNNLAAEVEKYNQVLQSYRPGPVGFQQPASPQAVPGFTGAPTTFTGSEESPVSSAAGLAGFLAQNPGFQMPQAARPEFVADGGSVGMVGGVSPLTRPGTPAFVGGPTVQTQPAPTVPQAAPQAAPQSGFSVAPPTFQVPQIPVPQRTTQAELRGFEQQSRPPAVQSILSGQMPKPLDLGFSLPTPQQYGALTPDEQRAFGSTLAIQYDVSPEDFETAIKKRFGRPQERSAARVTGF